MKLGGATGRILIPPTGNDSVPDRPIRLPGGGGGGDSSSYGFSQLNPGLPVNPRTSDQSLGGVYLSVQKSVFTIPEGTGVELLIEPAGFRMYLMIRNISSSLGILAVGWNTIPSNIELADHEFDPGSGLIWDYFVPQNRIFGYALNGDVKAIVDYSEKNR